MAASVCPRDSTSVQVGGVSACREEVTFRSGSLTLAGEWFQPGGEGPFPAVVVVRGSGDSSRGNVWTETLAGVLLAEGVGVLIPDKRGSGRSEGDWRDADFGELAGDGLAAVRYLASRQEVAAERIGLMGLSQGGEIVPIAGVRSQSVSFLINVVGAAVPFMENVRFEMLHTFREEGLSGERLEASMRMVDTAVDYLMGSISWETYESALGETRAVVGDGITDAYFIHTPDHWRWNFLRRMASFDPVDWWRRVDQPALVLLGGSDSNTDSAESARRLRRAFRESGHADATVLVFEGLGHSLWDMSGPMQEHGLHPDVRRALSSWVRRVTFATR